MDGYSHHDHKKRDLQISKGDSCFMQRGMGKPKMEARGVDKENTIVKCHMRACLSRTFVQQFVFRL